MNTAPKRRESDDPAKLKELARLATEWAQIHYPAPPMPKPCQDGHGTLDKFPWE